MLKEAAQLLVLLLSLHVFSLKLHASDAKDFWNFRLFSCCLPTSDTTRSTRAARLPPTQIVPVLELKFRALSNYFDRVENNLKYWANRANEQKVLLLKMLIQYVLLHQLLDYENVDYQEDYPAEAYPLDNALNENFIYYIASQPGDTPQQQIRQAENSLNRELANLSSITFEQHIENTKNEYHQRYNKAQLQEEQYNNYYNYALLLVYIHNNLSKILNTEEFLRNLPIDGIFPSIIKKVKFDLAKPALREQAGRDLLDLLKKPENDLN